ncbi:hypothetical protein J2Z69_000739 [Paenibacillus shirakamiensis]|uniref:Uncharacterized protein n=1 Tax=Paenibacillus shirakamiensis TaxID=1265935 RepID=A0ABS4JF77_9BACL|nr:hypothetical protein [Paenibacillus shirakamiensis]MBP1999720.1 hypothetical protein [Paenibacillus shirakamiensis]
MLIKQALYTREFQVEVLKQGFMEPNDIDFEKHKKLIFWGIKALADKKRTTTLEEAHGRFIVMDMILGWIGALTPKQLMTLFPVTKDFDGNRYGIKDYFFTLNVCETHGFDQKIGDAFDFIWDYCNHDISDFLIGFLTVTSSIRKFEGQQGLVEEYAAENGIKTYQMKEMNGSTILIENLVITKEGKVL